MSYTYIFFLEQERILHIIGEGTNIHEAFHNARAGELEKHKNDSNYRPVSREEVYGFVVIEGYVNNVKMQMEESDWA
jgi:hypothetical protein